MSLEKIASRELSWVYLTCVVACSASVPVFAETLPPDALLVGLQGTEWRLFVAGSARQQLRAIATDSEPRTPDICVARSTAIYIDAAGALREVDIKNETERVLLAARQGGDAYTQPAYDANCQAVLAVRLAEGSSADTDIIRLDLNSQKVELLVRQRSSQFEPRPGSDGQIYYGSVHCTVGCGRIIEEIWSINATSGLAGQVTLMNAVSQAPAPTIDGKTVLFSSNRDGYFHIWRQSLESNEAWQLTGGVVNDVSPAVDGAGGAFFIRRTPAATTLMHVTGNGAETPVALKPQLDDMRDLRIDWREFKKGVKTP